MIINQQQLILRPIGTILRPKTPMIFEFQPILNETIRMA